MQRRRLYRTVFLVAVVLALALFFRQQQRTRREIARLRNEVRLLEQKKQILYQKLQTAQYDLLNSDSLEFILKYAREQGMIKPGEIQVIDLDQPPKDDAQQKESGKES